jgi:hypothetical protein
VNDHYQNTLVDLVKKIRSKKILEFFEGVVPNITWMKVNSLHTICSRLLFYWEEPKGCLCKDGKHQCVTIGFVCAIGHNNVWQ